MNSTTKESASADYSELRMLAREATPGPWMHLFGDRTVYDRMSDGCRGVAIVRTDYYPAVGKDLKNLDFIAAANPAAVLALLDRIEELEKNNGNA